MIGKCICGAVAFELQGQLPGMYHCYCTLCQKQGGTASNAGTIVYAENFRWVAGQEKIQKWHKETGFSSHFCADCGSPVPNGFKSVYVWVPVGLMEDVNPTVKANIWLSSKPDWAEPVKLQRNYDGAPEDIAEFVRYLNTTESHSSLVV
jgi:hypothetical protein